MRAQEQKGVSLCVRKTKREESRERMCERDKKKVRARESIKTEESQGESARAREYL